MAEALCFDILGFSGIWALFPQLMSMQCFQCPRCKFVAGREKGLCRRQRICFLGVQHQTIYVNCVIFYIELLLCAFIAISQYMRHQHRCQIFLIQLSCIFIAANNRGLELACRKKLQWKYVWTETCKQSRTVHWAIIPEQHLLSKIPSTVLQSPLSHCMYYIVT